VVLISPKGDRLLYVIRQLYSATRVSTTSFGLRS
jgi:hypothetical protein